jgi:hypothetical protein
MRIDLTGQTFSRWTVEECVGKTADNGRVALWKCRCDCGNVKIVRSQSLRTGMSRSCGCLVTDTNRRLNTLPEGKARLYERLRAYKRSARDRGFVWTLTEIEFENLLTLECFYCGGKDAIGIDRIDNVLGYTSGNVRSCCKVCNYAKNTMTEHEFFAWVLKVYRRIYD